MNYSPLRMQGAGTRAATELSWASWRTLGAQVAGPVVRFGDQHCRFAATNRNGQFDRSAPAPHLGGSFAAPPAEYPTVAGIDLDGTRTRSTCAGYTCSARAQDGLFPVNVEHSICQLAAVTDQGGQQGLLRFGRHTPHLAWYLPHRFSHDGCQAQDGAMVRPEPVCGDGQLSYGEAARGAGCTQACRPRGL